jgi:hypothetical protein
MPTASGVLTLSNGQHMDVPHDPFGNPDGSRADLEDIIDGFVAFGGNPMWGGIATRADDRGVRVIVGRKGSGKTCYLRRLQVSTFEANSVFSAKIQQDLPTTEMIIQFCELFPGQTLTEAWMQLWRCAIIRSVASLLLRKKYFLPTGSP